MSRLEQMTSEERKQRPITRGLLDYFPDACAEVAHVSFIGNEQHNPGEEMHWAKEKSPDHADCINRHMLDRGTLDNDGTRHSAKVAWRALAMLQIEIENDLPDTPVYAVDWEKLGPFVVTDAEDLLPPIIEGKYDDYITGVDAGVGMIESLTPMDDDTVVVTGETGTSLVTYGCPDGEFETSWPKVQKLAEEFAAKIQRKRQNALAKLVDAEHFYIAGADVGKESGSITVPHTPVYAVDLECFHPIIVKENYEVSDLPIASQAAQGDAYAQLLSKNTLAAPAKKRVSGCVTHGTFDDFEIKFPTTFYVAGKMRGIPRHNFEAFDGARDFGHSLGYNIISPADLDRNAGFDPNTDKLTELEVKACIARDLGAITRLHPHLGDGIAVIPGWTESIGAVAEVAVGNWLGLRVVSALDFTTPINSIMPMVAAMSVLQDWAAKRGI